MAPAALAQAQTQPQPAPAPSGPPPKSTTVEGVTVNATTGGFKSSIDRRSYDITTDLQGAHGSIGDVLRNVPSVDVDLQGNVSLRGDRNVVVMIDGKPAGMFQGPGAGQMLQTVPADQFERVEVITNPTAAMAPDGTGGVINLITRKKRKLGGSGLVRATQGTGGRWNSGISGAWNNGRLNLSGDASLRGDLQVPKTIDVRTDLDPQGHPTAVTRATTRGRGALNLGTARVGADYALDDHNRVSADARYSDLRFSLNNVEEIDGDTISGTPIRRFDRTGRFTSDRADDQISGSWRRTFAGEGHELLVNLSRQHTRTANGQAYDNVSLLPAAPAVFNAFDGVSDLTRSEFKADYTRPVATGAKLKTGFDLIDDRTQFDNSGRTGPNSGAAVVDPTQTDLFRFDQAVQAAYVTFEQPIGKLTVLGGLRLESARLDINSVTTASRTRQHYVRVYPSLHMGWKLSDSQDLSLSYSSRIQRPSAGDLNPFRVVDDPFHIRAGNPNLRPQETQSYEAGYQYKQGQTFYLATLYYRASEKGVTDVITDLGSGVQLSTRENLARSRSAGLELAASGHVTKALAYNVSSNLFWTQIDATGFAPGLGAERRSATSLSGRGSLTWTPTPKDIFQFNLSVIGERLTPQGRSGPMPLANFGYRHKFTDAFSLVITAQDALATYKSHDVIETPLFRDVIDNRARTQAAFLGLSYTFGTGPRKEPGFDFGG